MTALLTCKMCLATCQCAGRCHPLRAVRPAKLQAVRHRLSGHAARQQARARSCCSSQCHTDLRVASCGPRSCPPDPTPHLVHPQSDVCINQGHWQSHGTRCPRPAPATVRGNDASVGLQGMTFLSVTPHSSTSKTIDACLHHRGVICSFAMQAQFGERLLEINIDTKKVDRSVIPAA